MNSNTKQTFESEYIALNEQLEFIYDELRKMKANSYRNNEKLVSFQQTINKASREIDRLREKYQSEYKIHELIKSVEMTYQFLLDDIRVLYGKPRRIDRIPNWKPRNSSFMNTLKNKWGRIRSRSVGGKRKRKTRKH